MRGFNSLYLQRSFLPRFGIGWHERLGPHFSHKLTSVYFLPIAFGATATTSTASYTAQGGFFSHQVYPRFCKHVPRTRGWPIE